MKPLFSIITVTYNAESTLPVTMRSVKEQTCHLFEHLIIDGASTDGTLKIANDEKLPQTVITSKPDNGLYHAMDKGLAMAQGDYVIFLNAGDKFHSPDTLQRIADVAMDNAYPGIIYGQTLIVDANGKRVGERHFRAPKELSIKSFANGMVVCHQAFVALRKITSPFALRYRFSADYEWCIRCLQHSRRNHYIDDYLVDYLNEGVTTRNHRKSLMERFRIMCHYYGVAPTVWRHILKVLKIKKK